MYYAFFLYSSLLCSICCSVLSLAMMCIFLGSFFYGVVASGCGGKYFVKLNMTRAYKCL
jgi:hypothetical protein